MSVGLFLLRRRWPGLLAAWLSYLVILAPNSGIIRISDQIAADRYSYMAMLGWVSVVAAFCCRLWQASLRARPGAIGMIALGLGLLAVLIPMTWDQCRIWRNSEVLWTHALNHGAVDSSLAHYNLAIVRYSQGKLDEAAAHTAEAMRLNPGDFAAHNNLGIVIQRQGNLEAAAAQFAEALRLNPDYRDAHYNLGVILSRQGKFETAAVHYAEALRLDPGFADAHHNLGIDSFVQGKLAEAEAHYTEAHPAQSRPRRHTHEPGSRPLPPGEVRGGRRTLCRGAAARSWLRRGAKEPGNRPFAADEARSGPGSLADVLRRVGSRQLCWQARFFNRSTAACFASRRTGRALADRSGP